MRLADADEEWNDSVEDVAALVSNEGSHGRVSVGAVVEIGAVEADLAGEGAEEGEHLAAVAAEEVDARVVHACSNRTVQI